MQPTDSQPLKSTNENTNRFSRLFDKVSLGYLIWLACTYILGLVFLNMYTTMLVKPLLYLTIVVMVPAGIYLTRQVYAEDRSIAFKHFITAIFISGMLIYSGYFSLLKADCLLAAAIKPQTEQQLIIKSLVKNRVRRIGWDYTKVNVLYQAHNLQFKATCTAFFLLQNKKVLLATMGQTLGGNYFVTDVHLSTSERWAARWAYIKFVADTWQWIVGLIIFVLLVIWLKRKLFPNVSIQSWSLQKKILVGLATFVTIFIFVCAVMIILVKLHGN